MDDDRFCVLLFGCSPQAFFGCNSLHDDLQSLVKEAESALEYGQLAGYRSVFFDKMALFFPPFGKRRT